MYCAANAGVRGVGRRVENVRRERGETVVASGSTCATACHFSGDKLYGFSRLGPWIK